MNWCMAYLTAVTVAAGFGAQPLGIRLSTSVRKESGSFLVLLDSSSGKAPAALQCDLAVPPAVTVTLRDIQLGSAAAAADKALTCAAGKGSAAMVRYTCILAGGHKPIADGPILVIRYVPQKEAGGAPVRIGIEKVLGVSADGTPIQAPDSEAILRIP